MYQSSRSAGIITKVVTIQPAYVVVNKTSYPIEFSQFLGFQCQNMQPIELQPNGGRKPFHWTDKT
jgi:hypothetical protein